MHLLAASEVGLNEANEPVDLGQSPADLVILSSADTELACFAFASKPEENQTPDLTIRLANLKFLSHPFAVDMYVEKTLTEAHWVIVRLLGGKSYFSYGVERLQTWAEESPSRNLVFLSGDGKWDRELQDASIVSEEVYTALHHYMTHGGVANAANLIHYVHDPENAPDPAILPDEGILANDQKSIFPLSEINLAYPPRADHVRVLLFFYRALVQAGDTQVIAALQECFLEHGIQVIPVFSGSLKPAETQTIIQEFIQNADPKLIVNAMGFALGTSGEGLKSTAFADIEVPIIQIILNSHQQHIWQESAQGLSASDLAMQVALPELDGKIISRAVSCKGVRLKAPWAEYEVIGHTPIKDRMEYVARLARNWLRLGETPTEQKRIAIILANYPNKNSRLGNGVGLDTPNSVLTTINAMQDASYQISDLPFSTGDDMMAYLQGGVTNAHPHSKHGPIRESLNIEDYTEAFNTLPEKMRDAINARWGSFTNDPFYVAGTRSFAISVVRLGNLVLGIQPARGYHIDPQESYHDPALIPPHGYFAFYVWLSKSFGAHALIQFGKHGNLEWLPGKALALSQDCYPEAMLGAMPVIYPFIVNDPGEGTQAKRRTSSVIIDHLMPAITRAGNEGELGKLEMLVDEYFQASLGDKRRIELLRSEILAMITRMGIAEECQIRPENTEAEKLGKLDGYLCELKEWQIRDGLHIFGTLPPIESLADLLVSMLRLKRGQEPHEQSIIAALAKDWVLAFNPLVLDDLAKPFDGVLPEALSELEDNPIRHQGHVRDRLEKYASLMLQGKCSAAGEKSQAVLSFAQETLLPLLQESADQEIKQILRALAGKYIPAGASGAPTRNRLDVLPTGRNFYSLDSRAIPTQTAWKLGWKSASLLLERHAQEHGDYPQTLTMSAWGTANMRTGGDDIAQALALIGVEPTWQETTGRVTGFKVIPIDVLGRPRVDVTLRISGFFRDAFPSQISLFDQAVKAVAERTNESATDNPLAETTTREANELMQQQGMSKHEAEHSARARIYGSEPEAYGAGMQALIEEGGWQDRGDFADVFIRWGGFRYGAQDQGIQDYEGLCRRLKKTQVVSHNQDNREHDILDSDDYYQFQGGLTASVASLSGAEPIVYHNDHSDPDTPKIRLLSEELARVVRARVSNPKWIKSAMRHGYKGAFEMAASVDYLFSFAATTHLVENALFDTVARAYLDDQQVIDFFRETNPEALADIAQRLCEAMDRDLWHPRSNHHVNLLQEILEQHRAIGDKNTV